MIVTVAKNMPIPVGVAAHCERGSAIHFRQGQWSTQPAHITVGMRHFYNKYTVLKETKPAA